MVSQTNESMFGWDALVSTLVGKTTPETEPATEKEAEIPSPEAQGEGRGESNDEDSITEERDDGVRDSAVPQGCASINKKGCTANVSAEEVKADLKGAQSVMTEIVRERDRKIRERVQKQDPNKAKCGAFTVTCNPEAFGNKEERSKPVIERKDDALEFVFDLVEIALCGDKKTNIDEAVAKKKPEPMPDLNMLRNKNIFQTLNPGKSRSRSSKSRRRSERESKSEVNPATKTESSLEDKQESPVTEPKDEAEPTAVEVSAPANDSSNLQESSSKVPKEGEIEEETKAAPAEQADSDAHLLAFAPESWNFFETKPTPAKDIRRSEADEMKALTEEREKFAKTLLAKSNSNSVETEQAADRKAEVEEIEEEKPCEPEPDQQVTDPKDSEQQEDLGYLEQLRKNRDYISNALFTANLFSSDQDESITELKSILNHQEPLPSVNESVEFFASNEQSDQQEELSLISPPSVIHLNGEGTQTPTYTYAPSIRKLRDSAKVSSAVSAYNAKSPRATNSPDYSRALAKPEMKIVEFIAKLISVGKSAEYNSATPNKGAYMLAYMVSFLFWPEDLPRTKVEKPPVEEPKPSLLSLVGENKPTPTRKSKMKRIARRRPQLSRGMEAEK